MRNLILAAVLAVVSPATVLAQAAPPPAAAQPASASVRAMAAGYKAPDRVQRPEDRRGRGRDPHAGERRRPTNWSGSIPRSMRWCAKCRCRSIRPAWPSPGTTTCRR
ncbi:hypothetical protein GMDG_08953, partial [Pseudogymnoascus destructans 20631-21]